ncbi:hypothetical protein G6F24_013849 [Rhizopus arrhizus]|nr:hypothetical protein G6F24_013849 [Rhizopus arrhizus]
MPLSSSEVDQFRGLEQGQDFGTKNSGVQLANRVDVTAEDPHCGKVDRGSVARVQEEPSGGGFFKVARVVEVDADQVLGRATGSSAAPSAYRSCLALPAGGAARRVKTETPRPAASPAGR